MTGRGFPRRTLHDRWRPDNTERLWWRRPEPGDLIAATHAVWRVTAIDNIAPDQADQAAFTASRYDTLDEWPDRPYRVTAHFAGGKRPDWLATGDQAGHITIRSSDAPRTTWYRYRNDRWPMCSCCGEPTPCNAELRDRVVADEAEHLEDLASRMPGCCWGCAEPITSRQQAIRYVGDNIDLPGGPPVVFHLRQSCHPAAVRYEDRWRAADPSRRRILTYPSCSGVLISHADGTHECVEGDPDCTGHLSHNHGTRAGCAWVGGGCRKGCPPDPRQSVIRRYKRPKFRDPDLPQGPPPAAAAKPDTRPACHGTLLTHRDGKTDCRGGRDDCWDDTKYRHVRRKRCGDQSHGCPTCEETTT